MAGISLIANRNSVVLYRTFSFRDENKKPQNNRKPIGKVILGTNKVAFNDYFVALLNAQGISLESLNGKSLNDISRLVDFTILIDKNAYKNKYFNVVNSIEISDPRLSKFNGGLKSPTPGPNESVPNISEQKIRLHDRSGQSDRRTSSVLWESDYYSPDNSPDETQEPNKPDIILDLLHNKYKSKEMQFVEQDFVVKSYGSQLLLENISKNIGLTDTLKDVFPDIWSEILTLAFYLVSENDFLRYCSDWLEHVEGMLDGPQLTITKIDEVLGNITEDRRIKFYAQWSKHLGDNEYLAYNVDSIISEKSSIDNIFLDYNKLNFESTLVNLALIFGAQSHLPVLAYAYSGQAAEASSFISAVDSFDFLNPTAPITFVFDKNFYNNKNINDVTYNNKSRTFLIPIPLNNDLATYIIEQCGNNIHVENFNFNNNKILFSFTIDLTYENTKNLKIYIFYDEKSNLTSQKDIYREIFMYKQDAESIKNKYKALVHTDFFHLNSSDLLASLELKHKNITNKYKHSGWFLILSNTDIDLTYILNTYNIKEYIDKYFLYIKNNLNIYNLYTNTNAYNNKKIFIGFISLILFSYMHNILTKNNLIKDTTVQKMIKDFNKIKTTNSGNKIYFSHLTPHQKLIYKVFNVDAD
ncbi:MAG: hypothetical protein LBT47_05340 [Deltaproteobacteria bacterium]|nr:hypothetical protein [Deltaproteobacteria bacterium]